MGLDSLELSIEIGLGMLIVEGVGLKLLPEYFRLVFEFADVIFHLGYFSFILLIHSFFIVELVGDDL